MLKMSFMRLVHREHREIQSDLDKGSSWADITARFNKKFKTNLATQALKRHFEFYREAEEIECAVKKRINNDCLRNG